MLRFIFMINVFLAFIIFPQFSLFAFGGPPYFMFNHYINEYMFNIMMAAGSTTTCREVTNNPEAAKNAVVQMIEAINSLSPNNKIDISLVVNRFDGVVSYCIGKPNELLLNALIKTSNDPNRPTTGGSQINQPSIPIPSPVPLTGSNNSTNVTDKNYDVTKAKTPVKKYKNDNNDGDGIEFIN